MELTPSYIKPLYYSNAPVINPQRWKDAVRAFDNGDYMESLRALLDYINPALLKGKALHQPFELVYPHGSTVVNLSLDKDIFRIKASFLRLPDKHKVPLMRKAAEQNFYPLTLTQIRYHEEDGGVLCFEYQTHLNLTQPNKIHAVIKEACIYADEMDDEYIKRYGATRFRKPIITPLDEADLDKAVRRLKKALADAFRYIRYFEAKRWDSYLFDTIINTLYCIVDQVYVNGVLRTSIEKQIRFLRFDKDTAFQDKLGYGVRFLKKLDATPVEDIQKDLYLITKLINTKYRPSHKMILTRLQGEAHKIAADFEEKNFINAFYQLRFLFQDLLYTYNLDTSLWHKLTDALSQAAGVPWEQGATILRQSFEDFLAEEENQRNTEKSKKKGFFARLFS